MLSRVVASVPLLEVGALVFVVLLPFSSSSQGLEGSRLRVVPGDIAFSINGPKVLFVPTEYGGQGDHPPKDVPHNTGYVHLLAEQSQATC